MTKDLIHIRIVELTHDKGFEFKYIKNDVFKLPEEVTAVNETKTEDKLTSIEEMVLKLRQSRLVQEKKFDNNISSFNFMDIIKSHQKNLAA